MNNNIKGYRVIPLTGSITGQHENWIMFPDKVLGEFVTGPSMLFLILSKLSEGFTFRNFYLAIDQYSIASSNLLCPAVKKNLAAIYRNI